MSLKRSKTGKFINKKSEISSTRPIYSKLVGFLKKRRQKFLTRAREGWGKCYVFVFDLPSKKISLQKSSALYFREPHLKKRGAFGIAKTIGFLWRPPKKKFLKTDLTLILVCLLKEARTYFSKNGGTLPSHAGSQSLLARMTRQKS